MPNVLTTASTVSCGHPPGAVQVSSTVKLAVDGAPVLLETSVDNQTVTAGSCGIVPNNTSTKCMKVTGITAGKATKLTVGGQPVLLQGLAGQTDGKLGGVTPQLLLNATANQTKLSST
jgi:hypothetical protein